MEMGFVDDEAYSIEASLLTLKFSDMKYLTTSVYNCYYLSNPYFASLRRLEDIIAIKEAFHITKEQEMYYLQDLSSVIETNYFNPKTFRQELLVEPFKLLLT